MEKADNKFKIDDGEGNDLEANFTNFEFLKRKVDLLTELVNEQALILKENGILKKSDPPILAERDVFVSLLQSKEESDLSDSDENAGDDEDEDDEEDDEDIDGADVEVETPAAQKKGSKKQNKGKGKKDDIEDQLEGIIDDGDDDDDEDDENPYDDGDDGEPVPARAPKKLPKLPRSR